MRSDLEAIAYWKPTVITEPVTTPAKPVIASDEMLTPPSLRAISSAC
jgi:hypothetical protein